MALEEAIAQLSIPTAAKVILILDASESAQALQAQIINLALTVLRALPAETKPALYFLGNPAPYDVGHLAIKAAQWFTENRRRASLLTPLFEQEQFTRVEQLRIAVIGAGQIFDLEDWQDTPQLERTLLVCLGDSLQAQPIAAELPNPTADELLRRLHDPVVRIEISGPGFMPTAWSNAGYKLMIANGRVALAGERLPDWNVTIRFWADPAGQTEAELTHASGARASAPLRVTPGASPAEPEKGWLTQSEKLAFEQAVHGQRFNCPRCGRECDWGVLRCRGQGGFGHLVYPSVEQRRLTGFVVLRREVQGVSFQATGHDVLPLGPGKVALKTAGTRPAIFYYNPAAKHWCDSGETFKAYHLVGDDGYAILV